MILLSPLQTSQLSINRDYRTRYARIAERIAEEQRAQ